MPSTPGAIARRRAITGADHPEFQISADEWNDTLVLQSDAPDGAILVRDRTQPDGWGFTDVLPPFLGVPPWRTINGHPLYTDVVLAPADIGLGHVEDIALSTWPGSSALTTVGTITGGTWHGTLIESRYGGTGSPYVSFTGPTAPRTYTVPDVDATLLTTGDVISPAQGGTGVTTGLTQLNASNLTTGIVPDERLSGNIARTDQLNNIPWASINKTSSSLGDLAVRSAADLNAGILALARLPPEVVLGPLTAASLPAHHVNHERNGIDAIKLDDLALPDDNADLDVSVVVHGLMPRLSGNANEHLNGVGIWTSVGLMPVYPNEPFLFLNGVGEWSYPPGSAPGAGTGDVIGPVNSKHDNIALFSGTSGKVIKDSKLSVADVIAAAVDEVLPVSLATDTFGLLPLASLPAHHQLHEPGGSDPLLVTAAKRLFGRGDSGPGAVQEIGIGPGLIVVGTTLAASSVAIGYAPYQYSKQITAPPGPQQIRFNTAVPSTVTLAFVSTTTQVGEDITAALMAFLVGSTLYVQDDEDPSSYIAFTVTAPPLNRGGYVEFAVALQHSNGVLAANKFDVKLWMSGHFFGTVVGPTPATADGLPIFNGTSGTLLKDSGLTIPQVINQAAALAGTQILPVNLATSSTGILPLSQLPAHAATHLAAGADAIKLDALALPDDTTVLDASATRHGLMQKYSGQARDVLTGTGVWSAFGVNLPSGAVAAQPTGLGPAHAGLLFMVLAPYFHLCRWDGTKWTFAPGDCGNGFFATRAQVPQEAGWQRCDGSVTDFLVVGGVTLTVASFTTPNLTGGVYLKAAGTYSGSVVGASLPVLSGQVAAAGAHGHTGATDSAGSHSHSGSTNTAGAHSHGGGTDSQGSHAHGGGTDAQGAHGHNITQDGSHSHNVRAGTPYGITGGSWYPYIFTGGQSDDAGLHSHATDVQGQHSHNISTNASGAHSHNIGTDTHAGHAHGLSTDAQGAHAHNVSVTAVGDHTHAIGTLAISGTGEPTNLPVIVYFRR